MAIITRLTLTTSTISATASPLSPPSQTSLHFPPNHHHHHQLPPPPPFLSLSLSPSKLRLHTPLSSVSATTTTTLLSSPPPPPQQNHSLPLLQQLQGMCSSYSVINSDKLLNLLRLSVKNDDVFLARAVHASILKLLEETHTSNCLITAYVKLGLLLDAYRVLTSLSFPDVVSYSALVSGFTKSEREVEAIELFFRMRGLGIEPNEYSFVAVLSACIRISELDFGLQIHALVVKLGYFDCVFVVNALMGLYGKCGYLECVIQLFDGMGHRDVASWNTMVSCLAKEEEYCKAFDLFRCMNRCDGIRIDKFTLSTILAACAGSHAVMEGRAVHAHAIRIGLDRNLSVTNAAIGFYTKCGNMKDVMALFDGMLERDVFTWTEMIQAYMEFGLVDSALELFKKMPQRNSVSFNALLAGLCQNGEGSKALTLFVEMVRGGAELTNAALTSVVTACGLLSEPEMVKQIHGFVTKFACRQNEFIEAALLDTYTRCGRMRDAKKMFHRFSSEHDFLITLTTLLCGYARNGQPNEALSLFHQCYSEGINVVDEVVLTSVLGVCGTLGFHEMGEQMHCLAIKTSCSSDLGVGNSIISMYSKCGDLHNVIKSFNVMPFHDVVSWNSLIVGYLLHRQGDAVLATWSRMEEAGIRPDAITFVLIISAYKYTTVNLVQDCHTLFCSMATIYSIKPTSEHYASLVGVFGFWGLLDEAEKVILEMPFEPDVSVWRALLDSCRIHFNPSIGKWAAKHILAMEPHDPSTYVLVSNLYSASGRWHCSEIVRQNMREKGFRKNPCRSWIVHQNKVHSFYARDKSHPQTKDIYSGLDILIMECLKVGYEPDTSFVLHEVEEHQKKDFLFRHSVKLAATYGILTANPGQPVRIIKNILLCGDCHSFLKHVSNVVGREIVVRDSSGFHFISNGKCSCNDYW